MSKSKARREQEAAKRRKNQRHKSRPRPLVMPRRVPRRGDNVPYNQQYTFFLNVMICGIGAVPSLISLEDYVANFLMMCNSYGYRGVTEDWLLIGAKTGNAWELKEGQKVPECSAVPAEIRSDVVLPDPDWEVPAGVPVDKWTVGMRKFVLLAPMHTGFPGCRPSLTRQEWVDNNFSPFVRRDGLLKTFVNSLSLLRDYYGYPGQQPIRVIDELPAETFKACRLTPAWASAISGMGIELTGLNVKQAFSEIRRGIE